MEVIRKGRKAKPNESIYCTSFCNQGHSLVTGAPIDHTCYRLNVKKLELEAWGRQDEIKGSIKADQPNHTRDQNVTE